MEYDIIELLRPSDYTELPTGERVVKVNSVYVKNELNRIAKDGWRFKCLIPDNDGTCIIERDNDKKKENEAFIEMVKYVDNMNCTVSRSSEMFTKFVGDFADYEKAQAKSPWYKFWK